MTHLLPAELERLNKLYPPGTMLKLNLMKDPYPVKPGTKGTVTMVDSTGQIHVNWECGSTLALQLEHDSFEIVPTQRESDLEFLRALQEQMLYEDEHDYDSQASPRFWTVGDYKWEPCWEGQADTYHITLPEAATSMGVQELKEEELENEEETHSEEALQELREAEHDDDVLDWIQEHVDESAELVPMHRVHIIRPDTMFLTKEEAKEHIRINHYHYTSDAHTYAMTAWRAPKVERLLKILHNFDFTSIEKEALSHEAD